MAGVVMTSGVAANQEGTFNTSGEQNVALSTASERAGIIACAAENDDGTVTGTRYVRSMETSEDYRLRVGLDQTLFNMSFEGAVFASDRLTQSLSGHTIAQATGFLTLNNAAAVTSGNYAIVLSHRSFPLFGTVPLYVEFWLREAGETATNAVSEWGIGYAATTATPTDGVFVRRLAGGNLRLVVNYGGSETVADLTMTSVPDRDGSGTYVATQVNHWVISINSDEVEVWCNDARVANIYCPSAQGSPAQSGAGRLFLRTYNSGTASAGRQIGVGFLNVSFGDIATNKPWSHVMCGMGGSSVNVQPGNAVSGTVSRASANFGWPTSTTALAVGTWTATSAPAANTLGGRWISPAISTLTSEADYPVFAYLNPAGTASIPGKTLYITNIRVSETIAMAAASTNGILLCYAAAVGSTAAATSTADGVGAVAPRIVPLGQCYFTSTAAVGQTASGFDLNFDAPLVVPPGCYWHFIVRPVGTVASNTLTVTGMVTPIGYFE